MAPHLSRFQWARKKTGEDWKQQAILGVLSSVGYYGAKRAGAAVDMRSDLTAIAVGVGAALFWTLVRFGWYFSRARIIQERQELADYRAEKKKAEDPLELDVRVASIGYAEYGDLAPVRGYLVRIDGIKITNRSRTDRVVLNFGASVGVVGGIRINGRAALAPERVADVSPSSHLYIPNPIGTDPQDTCTGVLGFDLNPAYAEVLGGRDAIPPDDLILHIEDLVSGKHKVVGLTGPSRFAEYGV